MSVLGLGAQGSIRSEVVAFHAGFRLSPRSCTFLLKQGILCLRGGPVQKEPNMSTMPPILSELVTYPLPAPTEPFR